MVPWADSWTPGLAPPWQGRKYTAQWPSLGASGLHAVDTLPFILWSLMHGWDWPTHGAVTQLQGSLFEGPQGQSTGDMDGPGASQDMCVGPGLGGAGPEEKPEG